MAPDENEQRGITEYVVVVVIPPQPDSDEIPPGRRTLRELGAPRKARNADEAIAEAVEIHGMPHEDRGACVAVPSSKWHEREVTVSRVPQITVTNPDDEAATD